MPIKLTDHTWFGAQAWKRDGFVVSNPNGSKVVIAFYFDEGQLGSSLTVEAAEAMLNHLQQAIWDAKSPVVTECEFDSGTGGVMVQNYSTDKGKP